MYPTKDPEMAIDFLPTGGKSSHRSPRGGRLFDAPLWWGPPLARERMEEHRGHAADRHGPLPGAAHRRREPARPHRRRAESPDASPRREARVAAGRVGQAGPG